MQAFDIKNFFKMLTKSNMAISNKLFFVQRDKKWLYEMGKAPKKLRTA